MMRRLIICVCTLVAAIGIAAQPRLKKPEIYVGIHGGVMGSTVVFSPKVKGMSNLKYMLLGGNGGVVFRMSMHKHCAFQIELNYMQRGWREYETSSDGSTVYTDYSRRLDYIELPILSHIYFGSERFRGFVNLGPQIGYCIWDRERGSHLNDAYQYKPIDKRFDWGAAGGLGVYYRSRHAGLYQIEARFNYGFGGIYNMSSKEYFSNSGMMNLSVNFAYLWEFGRVEKRGEKHER